MKTFTENINMDALSLVNPTHKQKRKTLLFESTWVEGNLIGITLSLGPINSSKNKYLWNK